MIGLGNPESDYGGTRHNLGADVVALLAERYGERLKRSKERSLTAEARIDGKRVVLAFPQTYMNDSGLAAAALVRRHGIEDLRKVVVVHDELDLPVGRVKLKIGGGTAGHNGLKSIQSHLHDNGFVRIRIGVDKPAGRRQGADHVLRRPGKAEKDALDVAVEVAAEAVEAILNEGPEAAMNRYNTRAD